MDPRGYWHGPGHRRPTDHPTMVRTKGAEVGCGPPPRRPMSAGSLNRPPSSSSSRGGFQHFERGNWQPTEFQGILSHQTLGGPERSQDPAWNTVNMDKYTTIKDKRYHAVWKL